MHSHCFGSRPLALGYYNRSDMFATAMSSQLASRTACFSTAKRPSLTIRPARALVVRAEAQKDQEPRSLREQLAVPAAALMAAALMFAGPVDPAEAARSGGRVGGSSGFAARKAAPPPAAAARTAPNVTNNVIVTSPPVFGGWGFGGFGMPFFPGFGVYPMFGFGLSSIFSIMVLLFVVQFMFSVVSNFTNKPDNKDSKKFNDDDW